MEPKQVPALLRAPVSIDWVKVGVFPFTGETLEQHASLKHYYRSMTNHHGMQYFMLVSIENPFNTGDPQAEN